MALGDIWRMTIKGVIGADDNQNVVHYRVLAGGGTPEQDAAGLAEAWEADVMTEYLAVLSSVYTIQTLSVRGVTHPTVGIDRTVTGNGAIAGEVSPTQTSALINLKTGAIGRSYMGKMYLPALAEASVSSGSILAAHIVNIGTMMAQGLIVISSSAPVTQYQWVVYSRLLGTSRDVIEWQVSPFARTQKRRTPGRGS